MLTPTPNTTINVNFIKARQSSWQVHLERISHFLGYGKGIWWERNQDGYHFLDGDTELDLRPEGPTLYHFNKNTIEDVEERRILCWKEATEERIPLPTDVVKLYDQDGNINGKLVYNDIAVLHVPLCTQERLECLLLLRIQTHHN